MLRHARDAVVAIDCIGIKMKIVQGVSLAEGQPVSGLVLLLFEKNGIQQFDLEAGFDSLMVRAFDIDGSNLVSVGVVQFEQLVSQPGAVKGQFPLEPPVLATRAQLQRLPPLRVKRRVNNAGVFAFLEFNHVVERGRLPASG